MTTAPTGRALRGTTLLALAIVPLLAVVLAACAVDGPQTRRDTIRREVEREPWEDPDQILAVVNGYPITRGEFYRRVLQRLGTMEIFAGVIKEELFRQEAARLGISVSRAAAEEAARRRIDQFAAGMGGRDRLEAFYRDQGMGVVTLRDLEREAIRKMEAELLTLEVTRALRTIDEEALREYYRRTYSNKRYVTRHVAYSFRVPEGRTDIDPERLKKEAYLKALRAAERVRQGADFATLARMESDDEVTRDGGGELGPITEYSPMPVGLKEAIFALAPGEVSDPVENDRGGYHVFQVTDIQPAESFVDCRAKLERELEQREPEPAEVQRVLAELARKAKVELLKSGPLGQPVEETEGGDAPPPVSAAPADGEGRRESTR